MRWTCWLLLVALLSSPLSLADAADQQPAKRYRVIFNCDGHAVAKDAQGDLNQWIENLEGMRVLATYVRDRRSRTHYPILLLRHHLLCPRTVQAFGDGKSRETKVGRRTLLRALSR